MLDIFLVAVGALAVVIAAVSQRLRRLPLSEPLLGLAAGVVLGPALLGALELPTIVAEHGPLHEGARVLLAISVMSVALRYPLRDAILRWHPVLLLLAVVLPAMALASAAVAAAALGVGLGAALLLGAAFSPTDPVLASSVVTGAPAEKDLPARNRELLSLESGANDGLALPLVLVAVAVAGPLGAGAAALEMLWQIVGALVVGAAAGWLGGHALRYGERHRETEAGALLLFTALLALAILGLSGLLHVDGVLAVFVGGLVFNHVSTGNTRTQDVAIDEAVNRFVVLPLFIVLGAALPWDEWASLGWRGAALVAGVLLLRRLPFVLALKRPLHLAWPDALWLGWFGPVGVSALFYLTLEAERLDLDPTVLAAGALVVAASTLAHGLTASLGRATYARYSPAQPGPQSQSATSGDS